MAESSQLSPLFTWRSAICESALPATTRHVLLTLSLHMNERGGSCFPSTRTLAAETGLSRRCVEKHLRSAAQVGWIEKEPTERKQDGTFRRAEYTATTPGERGSPGPGESDAQPGEPNRISQGNEVPHRTSVEDDKQRTPTEQTGALAPFSTSGVENRNGDLTPGQAGNQLVEWWEKRHPGGLSERHIKANVSAAHRLAKDYAPEQIRWAIQGMELYLWPYAAPPKGEGRGWSIRELEKHFPEAVQAFLRNDPRFERLAEEERRRLAEAAEAEALDEAVQRYKETGSLV